MNEKCEKKRIISLKIAKKIVLLLILVIIFDFFFFPAPALASEYYENKANISQIKVKNSIDRENIEINNQAGFINTLPQNNNWQAIKVGYYTLTAYSSEYSQCDDSPCITANGFDLCQHGQEDSVAANFLPFGTKIRIPDLFGDKVFIVRDRMNTRYQNRIDIWMTSTIKAKKFGIKIARVEILEP